MSLLLGAYQPKQRNIHVSCNSHCISLLSYLIIIIIIKTFITRKFAEAANARSVDSTEEKRLQSLFEDVQRDVR